MKRDAVVCWLGLALFFIGLGLAFGNTSGFFVTFPFAGFLAMLIGGIMFSTVLAKYKK